jgi:hypothetical protein
MLLLVFFLNCFVVCVAGGYWFFGFGIRSCDSVLRFVSSSGGLSGRGSCGHILALRAQTPIRDVGFVDGKAVRLRRVQAGSLSDGAVDVTDGTARPAHHVVVVVADTIFVEGGGADGLDASHDAALDERIQGVVYRLLRNRTDVGAGEAGDVVGRRVRGLCHCAQDGEALGGDDDSVSTKGIGVGGQHGVSLDTSLD